MTEFRYVGRKDNPAIVTGQSGFSSFEGQFDESLYQEYFIAVPPDAVKEISPAEAARQKVQQLGAAFEAGYGPMLASGSVPVPVRRAVMQLRAEINEHGKVGDFEAIEDAIAGFAIPDDLPADLKTQMGDLKAGLVNLSK
ncbi:MAG TPA: hypothetical protein VD994_09195 [Prosthecobacter sp.]|nr:hypothetical protein [Prosthecobacter sp.]